MGSFRDVQASAPESFSGSEFVVARRHQIERNSLQKAEVILAQSSVSWIIVSIGRINAPVAGKIVYKVMMGIAVFG
jgi:hypothetical protein